MADILATDEGIAPPQMGGAQTGAANAAAAREARKSTKYADMFAGKAKNLVKRLKHVSVTERRANDILRACGLEPLPLNDPGVLRDLVTLASGEKLSPVLVVSFDEVADIADGYHRVSLAYALDPFAAVPLRIASFSSR